MKDRRLAGSFWPSRRQELLLVAALAEPRAALEAWQELRPRLDLQTLDGASFVTLPLIHRMLQAAELDEPAMSRLTGIYRNTWVKNNLLAERLRATAEAFQSGDVTPLLVGGIGAALRYYPDLGLRPSTYVELMVEERDYHSAALALVRSGWGAHGPERATRFEARVFHDGRDGICVLRTALAPDFALSSAESEYETLRDSAMQIDVRGTPVLALAPTDDLLAVFVHGARSLPSPSIQWIVDAVMILRAVPEQIDWHRLLRIGIARGQALRLRDALEYVRRLLGLSAPVEIQQRLDEWSPRPRERLIHASTVRTFRGLGSFPQALGEHLAATAGRSVPATIAAVPGFLRERWQLERNWQLPLAGGRRAYRILVRNRGRTAHQP